MNTKIVVIRGPWWQELLSYLSFLFPFSLPFFPSPVGDFQYIERPASEKRAGGRQHHQPYYNTGTESGLVEEDLSPGGDYIRLLLLPKSFSPEFRGNWDDYRTEFWEKENERRAQLRQKLRQKERQLAQQDGGWFWWIGIGWKASQRRRLAAATFTKVTDDRSHHRHHHHSSISRPSHEPKSPARRSTRSESHSRTPSRSTTPVDTDDRPPSRSSASGRARRESLTPTPTASGSEQGQQHRRRKSKTLAREISPLTQAQVREGVRTSSFSSDDSGVSGEPERPKDEPLEN
ncbi:Spo7-like protein-domain-containing protein [Aspergillus coremiiformis]|uniref:Spo7-like protein-domain-containing protein n=1 Tax=Aspergillus coremiiformis TaxID=138285 RepID=A0A5N6Z325_9EURO|nr:Spo7-like protein-domain-containing protein [Aspergillus coremiiformis]